MIPGTHQLSNTGMFLPPPWSGFQPPYTQPPYSSSGIMPHVGENLGISHQSQQGKKKELSSGTGQRSAIPNLARTSQSYAGASKAGSNKALHGNFQKQSRTSFSIGSLGRQQYEPTEVRSKSLPSAQLPMDPQDLTVCIGSQAF